MALVRTNITLPAEVLALVDAVAGPRGRSAYIAEVVARQVRRDNARKVFRDPAGALRAPRPGARPRRSRSHAARLATAGTGRPLGPEERDAVPAGHHGPDRPRTSVRGVSDLLDRLFCETGDLFTCDAVVAEALSKGTDVEMAVIERLVQALEYVSTTRTPRAGPGPSARGRRSSAAGRRYHRWRRVDMDATSSPATRATSRARVCRSRYGRTPA